MVGHMIMGESGERRVITLTREIHTTEAFSVPSRLACTIDSIGILTDKMVFGCPQKTAAKGSYGNGDSSCEDVMQCEQGKKSRNQISLQSPCFKSCVSFSPFP